MTRPRIISIETRRKGVCFIASTIGLQGIWQPGNQFWVCLPENSGGIVLLYPHYRVYLKFAEYTFLATVAAD
jgi:hypothetical protein